MFCGGVLAGWSWRRRGGREWVWRTRLKACGDGAVSGGGGLLGAEGAEAEEAFVAGEVDFDCDGRAVVGEGHRKIRRALQLEADHGVAAGFLQHHASKVHVGDHLRGVESVIGWVARDIRLPSQPGEKKRRTCGSGVG